MKRIATSWFVVLVFAALTGCAAHRAPGMNGCLDGNGDYAASTENGAPGEACRGCGRGECSDPSDGFFHPGQPACSEGACQGRCPCQGRCAGRGAGAGDDAGPGGPPTGGVAYPYYTVRGPRDFLAKNPPSIGP
jgi:hypothetical protein